MRNLLQRCQPLYQVREFRVLFVLNILVGLGHSFVGPFLSVFGTKEVGMNPFVFGTFMTLLAVGGITNATILSHYSDTKYSRRSMMLLGGIFGVIGYIGFAYFRTFLPLVLTGAFILGVASITFSQSFAYAREAIGRSTIPASERVLFYSFQKCRYGVAKLAKTTAQ